MENRDWLEQEEDLREEPVYPEGFPELVERLGFSSPDDLFAEGMRLWEEELAGRNDDDYVFNGNRGCGCWTRTNSSLI